MPRLEYSEWDGTEEFKPLSADAVFDTLSEYLLNYGENVLRRFDDLDSDQQDILDLLVKEGYIERDEKGQYRVSPKGIRRVEEKALHDLFQVFNRDTMGKHDTGQRGAGQVKLEDSKPYKYGDSLASLNLHETLRNALLRQQTEGRPAPTIHLGQDHFLAYEP